MSKKETKAEKALEGTKFAIGVSQIVQDFLPEKLGTIVSIMGTINQICKGNKKYKAILNTFYDTLINSLKILEVNQFHDKYNDALKQIENIFGDAETQTEDLNSTRSKIKVHIKPGNLVESLQKLVDQFNLIKDIFHETSSYDILTAISDPKAASFWNIHIGASVSNCPFDTLRKELNLCTDIKCCTEGLEKGSDNLIADNISKEHFNYVVSWLGGWKKFVEYIKEDNPFTKEFFEKMSKEIKPPTSVNIDISMEGSDYKVTLNPATTYWYSGDGKTSHSLSFMVYYKEGSKPSWEVFELELGRSLKVNPSVQTFFEVFSVYKEKGIISNEWTERVFSNPGYKKYEIPKIEKTSSSSFKKAWISPEDVVLTASKEKRSPIFKGVTKLSLTDKIYNDYEIKNIRPVIYVSNAAYSLAKKLGYFFSPEILLHLWRDPKFILKSSFAERIIRTVNSTSTDISETRKEFVYQSVLKKNSELNKVIQVRFPGFNWVPAYDESKYNEVSESISKGKNKAFKDKIEKVCEQFRMELGSVVVEYLSNKIIVNLCAAGAYSNIHGYIGSPNVRTMKDLKPGHIIVLNQNLLGHTNTFISRVNIEGNKLNSLKKALKMETLKFSGETFYRELAAYAKEDGHNIWTDDEANPVPSVFLPDQISFSLVENTFAVKPKDDKNQASVDGILSWMREHQPKIRCIGSNYNTDFDMKIPTFFNTGVEFYARGDFIMEIKKDDIRDPCIEVVVKKDIVKKDDEKMVTSISATLYGREKKTKKILPFSFEDKKSYIGFIIQTERSTEGNTTIIKGCGEVSFEIRFVSKDLFNTCCVFFKPLDGGHLDIVNFHNI